MKAILINGQLKYQSQFKSIFNKQGVEVTTNGFTEQQWLYWGFREEVEAIFDSTTQVLGDWIKTDTTITREVINKTVEKIAEELENAITGAIRGFENDTDNLIRSVVGERANEYLVAEEEAIAFKDAGYPDADVPSSVSSDSIANSYSNTIACDNIIVMATNWRAMQTALRAQRLLSKAQVKAVTLVSEIAPIKATWDGFLVELKSQITD